MAPPSRRTLLRTCGVAAASGLAGCASTLGYDPSSALTTPNPLVEEAALVAENAWDRPVTLTVELRRDDRIVAERTRSLPLRVEFSMAPDTLRAGSYTVVARLEAGTEARREWTLDPSYEGTLAVVVSETGDLTFEESLADGGCSTEGLPYRVPGAEETYGQGTLYVENDRETAVTPTVSVAHDGERFFECDPTVHDGESVTVDGLTVTAGRFTATVTLGDDANRAYEWWIRPGTNRPALHVHIPETGPPRIGCRRRSEIPVTVRNQTTTPRSVTLRLQRDGETVMETTVDVAADGEATATIEEPIGDVYTLAATTDTGTDRAVVANCLCAGMGPTTVTLSTEGPQVDRPAEECDQLDEMA